MLSSSDCFPQDIERREKIAQVLQEQYQSVENYCNATTILYNATQHPSQSASSSSSSTASSDLYQATLQQQDSLGCVQNNLRSLEKLIEHYKETSEPSNDNADDGNNPPHQRRRMRTALEHSLCEHVARTRRILTTIYHSGQGAAFHTNGLPVTPKIQPIGTIASSAHYDSRLVALTTLRASIKTVTDNL